jgi:hypothetical protein
MRPGAGGGVPPPLPSRRPRRPGRGRDLVTVAATALALAALGAAVAGSRTSRSAANVGPGGLHRVRPRTRAPASGGLARVVALASLIVLIAVVSLGLVGAGAMRGSSRGTVRAAPAAALRGSAAETTTGGTAAAPPTPRESAIRTPPSAAVATPPPPGSGGDAAGSAAAEGGPIGPAHTAATSPVPHPAPDPAPTAVADPERTPGAAASPTAPPAPTAAVRAPTGTGGVPPAVSPPTSSTAPAPRSTATVTPAAGGTTEVAPPVAAPVTTAPPLTTAPPPPPASNAPIDAALAPARIDNVLASITYPWRARLPGWTIAFLPGRPGLRGLTFVQQRRIEVYVRADFTDRQVADIVAHELGHAVDVTLLDDAERLGWLAARGLPATTPWFDVDENGDFGAGTGDFAEAFATWQVGKVTQSRLAGPPTAAQLALRASLAGG